MAKKAAAKEAKPKKTKAKKLEIKDLTLGSFKPHLNTTFTIDSDFAEGTMEVELVEAADKSTDMTEAFSLLFKGPKVEGQAIPHETHKISHPEMGAWEMFMGPVSVGKADGTYYESIFNRLKK